MGNSRLGRLAPLSGVGLFLMMILSKALIRPLAYFPPAERAHAIFSHHPARVQRGANLGAGYRAVFLLWFAGSISNALREREGKGARLSVISLAGTIVTVIGIAFGGGILWVAADRAAHPGGIAPDAALILYDMSIVMLANVLTLGHAVFAGATGIGSMRTRLLPA